MILLAGMLEEGLRVSRRWSEYPRDEQRVLNLWLLLAVVAVGLMVLLWVGGMFVQGYIYTEPAPQMVWAAPAAGALLAVFFAWWCYAVAGSPDARPEDIPYDTIFRFSPRVEMVTKPVKELWAIKANGEKTLYRFHPSAQLGVAQYKDATTQRPWNGNGVKAIEVKHDGETFRFEEVQVTKGEFPRFENEKGWRMKVFESGPTGKPDIVRKGRLLANVFFNLMHFLLWFVCLWLLLRFQWAHALGFGFCLWLAFTLAVLPMMLGYAAQIAQRSATSVQAALSILPGGV